MTVLLAQLRARGIEIEPAGDGSVRVRGRLTDDLRTVIRANKPAILAELAANDSGIDVLIDSDVARRRAKALALLHAGPTRQIAIVAEAGDPAHVAIAIRGGVVGEIEISSARYDAFALLALMQQHGHA
jgi:hypothetical protein